MAHRSHIANRVASVFVRYQRDDKPQGVSQHASMSNGRKDWFLREWRAYRGLSQEKLGEMINSSKGYISDLEAGKRRYNQDFVEALAIALDCTPAELIGIDPRQRDTAEAFEQWNALQPKQRRQAFAVVTALKATGTEDE